MYIIHVAERPCGMLFLDLLGLTVDLSPITLDFNAGTTNALARLLNQIRSILGQPTTDNPAMPVRSAGETHVFPRLSIHLWLVRLIRL